VIVFTILAGVFFVTGNHLNQPAVVQAQVAPAPDGVGMANCAITAVSAMASHIALRCSPSTGGIGPNIIWFVPAAPDANRMLALLIASSALNRQPVIHWDDDPLHNPPDCLVSDCRLLLYVGMP
jgi:hypothetical protein